MQSPKTLIIIGDGIAASLLNEELEKKYGDVEIYRVASEAFAPKCSVRTTAVNCLRGTRKGISPLGDLIVDSMSAFDKYLAQHRPAGIEETFEVQLWDPQDTATHERFSKRFGEWSSYDSVEEVKFSKALRGYRSRACLISPEIFLSWVQKRLTKTRFIQDVVVEVKALEKGFLVKGLHDFELKADKLFICAGSMSSNFSSLVARPEARDWLARSKPVGGSFLKAPLPEKVGRSFSLVFGKWGLIFRKEDQTLLLGATTENNNSILAPRDEELRSIRNEVAICLEDSTLLAPLESWQRERGIRHKGPKRMPFWGELSRDCYGIFGLYKNAFSFAFLAAEEVARRSLKD